MRKITLDDIRKAEESMGQCPFCGDKANIIFTDDEGNYKDQDSSEYLDDPWSGLAFWIQHNVDDCVISTGNPEVHGVWTEDEHYCFGYDTPQEAADAWNKRYDRKRKN